MLFDPHSISGVRLRLAVLILAQAVCGCGGETEISGNASGKVTLDGQAVTSGSISFISEDGKVGTADMGATGEYAMKDVVVGDYKVVISPPALPHPGMPGTTKKAGQANFPQHPVKYRSDLTSGLTAQVNPGENSLDFDMQAAAGGRK